MQLQCFAIHWHAVEARINATIALGASTSSSSLHMRLQAAAQLWGVPLDEYVPRWQHLLTVQLLIDGC
jgi:hypothetical protein